MPSKAFINDFPILDGLGSILLVIDRCSKYVIFIAVPQSCQANAAVKLFFKHAMKILRLPKDIINDRHVHFTGKF